MFFGNISGKICKLDLDSGKIQFEEKFAGVFARSRFHLFISNNKVYLISKKKTLLLELLEMVAEMAAVRIFLYPPNTLVNV